MTSQYEALSTFNIAHLIQDLLKELDNALAIYEHYDSTIQNITTEIYVHLLKQLDKTAL